MTIDATFWVMISFFLFIGLLIYFQIPQKIKTVLEENISNIKNQIKEDLESANEFKELSELKFKEYEKILENSKKEVIKMQLESKNKLDKDIQTKKNIMEKEIEIEITKAQKEIVELKKNSIADILNISKDLASDIIENITGDKLNENSIKAAVEDVSKKKIGKYL